MPRANKKRKSPINIHAVRKEHGVAISRLRNSTCDQSTGSIFRCLEFDEFHVQVETTELTEQERVLSF